MPSQVKAQCDRPDASALSVTYNLASAAELVPPVVRVVAAFHLLAAEALQDLEHEVDCDAIVCGEKSARERVRPLAESILVCATSTAVLYAGPLRGTMT